LYMLKHYFIIIIIIILNKLVIHKLCQNILPQIEIN
jgi:hypothetical protein